MSELLGAAVLETGIDLKPLEAGLIEGRRMTLAELDKTQVEVNRRMAAMAKTQGALGKKMQASMVPAGQMSLFTKDATKGTDALAASEAGYTTKLKDGTKARNDAAAAAAGLSNAQIGGRKSTEDLRKSQQDAEKAQRDLSKAQRDGKLALNDAFSAMGAMGSRASTLQGHMESLKTHGVDYLAGGVLGLVAGMAVMSARAAMHFEALTKTVQQQTGLSGRALAGLMATIQTVTASSPYTMQQVADAATVLKQAFHASDGEVGKFSNDMVAFSNATGQQVRPQVQQLSRIMHDFRLPLSQVTTLTDKLVSVSQATQQPIGQMVNTIDKFGPRLQALGFGLNDSVKMMGLFAESGISAQQMGRGLTSALTSLTKATTTGPQQMLQYRDSITSASLALTKLQAETPTATKTQADLNTEIGLAQNKLDIAKLKYSQLTAVVGIGAKAHGNMKLAIDNELASITHATSKQDAQNLAVGYFGKQLGPSMVRAYYDNQKALDAVDKALHKTGATQKLFNVDQHSLSGQVQEAKNHFQDLEIVLGNDVLPVFSTLLGYVTTGIRDVDRFVKSHRALVEVLGGVAGALSAVALASRHISPLGNLLGGIAQKGGHTGLAQILTGKSGSSSATWGVRGPVGGGGISNPVAVAVVDGGQAGLGSRAAPGTTMAQAEQKAASAAPIASDVRAAETGASTVATGAAEAASTVGTTAAVAGETAAVGGGAALAGEGGMLAALGPVGIAAGGVMAAGFVASTFGPQIVHFLGGIFGSPSWGTQLADSMSKGFGSPTLKKQVGSALDAAGALAHQAYASAHPTAVGGRAGSAGGMQAPVPALTAAQKAKLAADYQSAGTMVAKQLEKGWNQYKFQDEPTMFKQFNAETKKLPPQAKFAAAQSALAFAQSLEQAGRLPKGATQKMLASIEAEYPSFTKYLGTNAKTAVAAFTANLDFTKAAANTSDALTKMSSDWPPLQKAMTDTAGTFVQKGAAVATVLQNLVSEGGKAGKQAAADLATLQAASSTSFDLMVTKTVTSTNEMSAAIRGGSKTAADAASAQFQALQQNIYTGMNSGLISTTTGAKLIGQALNAELKLFGGKTIPLVGLDAGSLPLPKSAFAVAGNSPRGHAAGGGLFQIGRAGDGGHDTIPMTIGGQNVMVGSGEVAAVFNRHQVPMINQRLSADGGLSGFFNTHTRPNYLSGGGIVTASDYGGPSDPTSGVTGYRGDNLTQHPDTYAELKMGTALGGLPYLAPLDVSYGGKTERLYKRDIGLGGPGLGGHVRAIDLWYEAAKAFGFPGLANVLIGGPQGVNVKVTGGAAGGAGAAAMLPTPKALGAGADAKEVQAALDKMTSAANTYLTAHTASAGAGGGAGSMTFQPFSGKLPTAVQKALQVAVYEVNRHIPYGTGQYGAYYGVNAPSLDCSGMVSTILNAAGLDPAGHLLTGGLKTWGDPGPGKYITVGVLGADSGPTGHTMMEIANRYFESGGGGGGPHEDTGWSSTFPWKRHPRGLAGGGAIPTHDPSEARIGRPGHQPTMSQLMADQRARITMAAGGIVDYLAGGGTKYRGVKPKKPRWAAKTKTGKATGPTVIKAPKPAKPARMPKLPKLAGFDQALMDQITELDQVSIPELGGWQSYLTGLYGVNTVTPTITLADGSTIVNWGSDDPNAALGHLTGANDPTTGLPTLGIYDRLREIGDPTTMPSPTGDQKLSWDQNTALGIEDTILNDLLAEQALAGSASLQYGPWLKMMQASVLTEGGAAGLAGSPAGGEMGWLTAALDPNQPLPKIEDMFQSLGAVAAGSQTKAPAPWNAGAASSLRPKVTEPVALQILEYARSYKNAIAKIARWAKLKAELPLEQSKRTAEMAARYAAAKHSISLAGMTSTFDAGVLKQDQLAALSGEQKQAALNIPTAPPAGWAGDAKTWTEQRKQETADLSMEYSGRKLALEQAFSKTAFQGKVSRTNALYALSSSEAAEKLALGQKFGWEKIDLGNRATTEKGVQATDKTYLTNLKTATGKLYATDYASLTAGTTPGTGFGDLLKAYLDPHGALSISIDQAAQIDVPALLTEITSLTGTNLAALGPSADTTAMLALIQEQNAVLGQQVAALTAQANVLGTLPPFGGSFAEGGIVPGPTGAARTIIAHGGEPVGMGSPPVVENHLHFDGSNRWLADFVDMRVQTSTRATARTAGRLLPSRGGGR